MPAPSTNSSPRTGARLLKAIVARGGVVRRSDYGRPTGRVAAWRVTPKGAPRGRVIIAHATGNDAFYPHAALTRSLFDAGYEIFLFDLDGHGVASSTKLDPDRAADMVSAAFAEARASAESMPTFALGQSLGASLTVTAGAEGIAVDGIVAISLPAHLALGPRAGASELLSGLRPSFWRLAREYGPLGLAPAVGPFRRGAYPVRLVNSDAQGWRYPAEVARLIAALDLDARLPLLSAPLLVIHGSHDLIAPEAAARRLAAMAPQGRFLKVVGATHFTTVLETATTTAVLAFLKERA